MSNEKIAVYVWSKKIRVFHWLNVIAITLLLVIGIMILNAKLLGVSSDGKVLLKTVHVLVGYVFVANLFVRLLFGLIGKGFERFSKTLPFFSGFTAELHAFKKDPERAYQGHNPLGKLMVGALFLLLTVQATSGVVLAGTDIYYPPFGDYFAHSVALDKTQVDLIKPYSKDNVDPEEYQAMRTFRSPFITLHVYTFYALLVLIPLHIIGVVIAEKRQRSALVSAMINGVKYLPKDRHRH